MFDAVWSMMHAFFLIFLLAIRIGVRRLLMILLLDGLKYELEAKEPVDEVDIVR